MEWDCFAWKWWILRSCTFCKDFLSKVLYAFLTDSLADIWKMVQNLRFLPTLSVLMALGLALSATLRLLLVESMILLSLLSRFDLPRRLHQRHHAPKHAIKEEMKLVLRNRLLRLPSFEAKNQNEILQELLKTSIDAHQGARDQLEGVDSVELLVVEVGEDIAEELLFRAQDGHVLG